VLEQTSIAKRREALVKVPKNLDDAYQVTIDRIKRQVPARSNQGMDVLKGTYFTERQLTISELRHAISASNCTSDTFGPHDLPFEKSLIDCCYGLVIIDQESSFIRLVHKSLQDSLDKQHGNNQLFENGHCDISLTCIRYMSFNDKTTIGSNGVADDEDTTISNLIQCNRNTGEHMRMLDLRDSSRLKRYPFLEYAIHSWGEHVRKTKSQQVLNLVVQFPVESGSVTLHFWAYSPATSACYYFHIRNNNQLNVARFCIASRCTFRLG
jgi:hypothetical protein